MDKKLFSKIKKIERITFIFDFLAIVAYISLFLIFFNLLELPAIDPLTGDMKLDDLQYMEPIYELLGRTFDKWQMNSIISVLIIFMVVSVPMIFINIKKNKTKTIYDFDSYTAANTFIQAIINLITLNIVGFGLRIYNMFLLIKFVKGYSPKE
ncbi:MAG: hypothetical protein RBR50_09260, partial [Candidatus Izemoplasmatales bacterium]|nr:hypothetical protein [Candidatus Izemoplasmatales bacterium]